MKKLLLTFAACTVFTAASYAQIIVPKYEFETKEDYTLYNDAILECCNWLMNTSIPEGYQMLDEVVGFIVMWSMGSPDVMILIDEYFMPYMAGLPPLIAWHMAGASKYQLERGIYATSVEEIRESTLAGVNAVLDYYEANKEYLGGDKGTEKMLKIRKKGKLEAFLAKRITRGIEQLPPHKSGGTEDNQADT